MMAESSRAIARFGVSVQAPSAIQPALVLRQAIWRQTMPRWSICGIPETFYTDHGRDFAAHHLGQVRADLPMGLVFSEAGMPRRRGRIERFFRPINQMLLGGLPGSTLAGTPPGKRLLTWSAFAAHLQHFSLEHYHQRPHRETGVPPHARWAAGGVLPRRPESLEQLDLLRLTVATSRKVRPEGMHCQGLCSLDPTLAASVGEQVLSRYDPRDMAEMRGAHDHRVLRRAICSALAGETVALREIIQARNHRRTVPRHTLHDRARAVVALLETHRGYRPSDECAAANGPTNLAEKDAAREQAPQLKRYRHE